MALRDLNKPLTERPYNYWNYGPEGSYSNLKGPLQPPGVQGPLPGMGPAQPTGQRPLPGMGPIGQQPRPDLTQFMRSNVSGGTAMPISNVFNPQNVAPRDRPAFQQSLKKYEELAGQINLGYDDYPGLERTFYRPDRVNQLRSQFFRPYQEQTNRFIRESRAPMGVGGYNPGEAFNLRKILESAGQQFTKGSAQALREATGVESTERAEMNRLAMEEYQTGVQDVREKRKMTLDELLRLREELGGFEGGGYSGGGGTQMPTGIFARGIPWAGGGRT